ncbi:TPA: hypothetical protein DDZ06_00135 [Candidatus Uhrbacteria bacterium]|nr:hypothetical protein [Candidatus Uhrbacteria bacterium]
MQIKISRKAKEAFNMARKRKRSSPVPPPKKDENIIHIPKEDLPKRRRIPPPPSQFHKDKSRYTRHPKHKGRG